MISTWGSVSSWKRLIMSARLLTVTLPDITLHAIFFLVRNSSLAGL